MFKRLLRALLGSPSDSTKDKYEPPEGLPNVSSGGMVVAAHCGEHDSSRLPESNDSVRVVSQNGEIVSTECGHKAHQEIVFSVYGEEICAEQGSVCVECGVKQLSEITIRCALCGLPILPGNGVALYDIESPSLHSDWAYLVNEGATALGCLRMDCCPSGGFFGGNWMGPEEGFRPYQFDKAAQAD